ncbi:Cytochrome P450 78A9 [Linum grandiflorum]
METTTADSFWLLLLASKLKSFSSHHTILIFLFLSTLFLLLHLYQWTFPGGPAWGKLRFFFQTTSNKKHARNYPNIPGPRGLPLVGSMNLMTGLAHHKLAAAAKLHNAEKLMAFSVGETRFIVTGNPDVAKEILNSSAFADRPIKESAYGLMFNRAIGFAPYGAYWRTLRRIAANHMFSPKQISLSAPQRCRIASQMVSLVGNYNNKEFRVRDILKAASLNNMMSSVFGREYRLGCSNFETEELRELVEEGYDLLGMLNWSDHLPWLASLDLQMIRFRCSNLVPKVNRFVNRIIEEHRNQTGSQTTRDFVDVLLSLDGPDKLSDHDMIAVLWEMIFRGTDTVAVLIEWILARMVLHPEIQSKVQDELDRVVGKSRPLMESDVPSMVYLQALVKEGLRLHPPGPLLSWARLATTDTTINGHHIPAGTTAMVNMWAITRDPQFWAQPLKFSPDRFISADGGGGGMETAGEFSVMGSDLRLAPFGAGRRTCPGKALGFSTVVFWVGTLLHEFEWFNGSTEEPVDLSEKLRLSCEMMNPLTVKVKPRRSVRYE